MRSFVPKSYSDDIIINKVLRPYHFEGKSQGEIARATGMHPNYVSKLCQGKSRPDLYEQVSKEEKRGRRGGSKRKPAAKKRASRQKRVRKAKAVEKAAA